MGPPGRLIEPQPVTSVIVRACLAKVE